MNRPFALFVLLFFCLEACHFKSENKNMTVVPQVVEDSLFSHSDQTISQLVRRNGKLKNQPVLDKIYTPWHLDSLQFPIVDGQFIQALENNLQLLEYRAQAKNQQIGDLRVSIEDLRQCIHILKKWQHTIPMGLASDMEAYQIWGEDRRGNVRFTAYYTPVIEVDRQPSSNYRYPIYSRPLEWEGPLPSRAEIDGQGVFKGRGLELAYASNKLDIYFMQLQGSGFVEYPNGKRELFAYNGSNKYPYRSIESYMKNRADITLDNFSAASLRKFFRQNPALQDSILFHNPSYTFFSKKKSVPKGAGNVPLTDFYSLAVDRRYIPLGSCLLADFPIYDQQHKRVIGHEFRLFVAQDVGGAIKGPGHVDTYIGTGAEAEKIAGRINYYGRMWLLLPKKDKAVLVSN
ncbi:MAG TPA: MltA domain-containing protein [Saprospiraceae bacterium]|nr:MltA domain-containing protein [Saprospiraceae bacterium]HMQ82682.1 MltA domain-containing protein [Saprospiraceae bacterium]